MKFELTTFNRNVPEEDLLNDLIAANEKLKSIGKSLTYRSYYEIGNYSANTFSVRFGSWNDALSRAGLNLNEEKNIPIEALFDNLKIIWIAKGRQPVLREMGDTLSKYTGSVYSDRFGSWRKALGEFVAFVEHERYAATNSEVQIEIKNNTLGNSAKRDPSLGLRFLVLKKNNFCCVACGRSPATVTGLKLEIDHIKPWSNGGKTIEENLQTLCFDCNRGKGASC
jgi:HNH endonuclease/Homing endonuclease associated repeat